MISNQNPTLNLSCEGVERAIKPLFRKGPREGPVVHWVCEVAPEVFKNLAGSRIFLGFSLCRVVEFLEASNCYVCQGFGHFASKCSREKLVCKFCSEVGHKIDVCPNREKAPKCANCGLAFMAGHRDCVTRRKVIQSMALRTDYVGQSR